MVHLLRQPHPQPALASSRVEVGMVGVNVGVAQPFAFFLFSGWKGSFYGDLHANGADGLDFYTRKKVVVSRWER